MRKNRQFQYMFRKGKSSGAREMALIYLAGPRLLAGFSVSKKVGNAVIRNRVKRRMREAFRKLMPALKCGQYVLVAREAAAEANYFTLEQTIIRLLKKQGLLEDLRGGG